MRTSTCCPVDCSTVSLPVALSSLEAASRTPSRIGVRSLRLFAAIGVALVLAACSDVDSSEEISAPPGSTGGATAPPEEVDCTAACADTSEDAGWALCYSCRCKAAMDGWLPTPDELQCANGEEIVAYTTDEAGVLTEVDRDVSTCMNPSLLYGTCRPGGRLGQLTRGTVTVKWICRRNEFRADHADLTAPYDDVGVILYNSRNGASCWFDDIDGTGLAGDNWPDMDLSAPTGDVAAYTRFFYNTDGAGCTGCHDSDPFLLTPYLRSVKWVTDTAYTLGGFSRVTLDGSLVPADGLHLTSPDAAACTTCHRIAATATCGAWAPDSLGLVKGAGYQTVMEHHAGDPASPLWSLETWMPTPSVLGPTEWEKEYGLARDTLLQCCQSPGVETPGCTWAPYF